jgi:2-keto-4-pentenoate hydratase/2-oxohepta-3-ene-1,7-dioic acid hydratase in catechol pathway
MRQARLRTDGGIVRGQYRDGRIVADDGEYRVGRDGSLTYPCSPSAIYCVGRNYADTLEQMDYERPSEPDFFIKPPASLLGHGDAIRYPRWTDELTYAGELAAVVGRRCRDVPAEAVSEVIRGYTILNDVDALDQAGRTARKAFDGSGPLGPWIETDLDPVGIGMKTVINGETRQDSNTKLMLFDPSEMQPGEPGNGHPRRRDRDHVHRRRDASEPSRGGIRRRVGVILYRITDRRQRRGRQ